ncbi:hypothetical protein REPUB_Repub02eG0165400 [Reevesia pubescens]
MSNTMIESDDKQHLLIKPTTKKVYLRVGSGRVCTTRWRDSTLGRVSYVLTLVWIAVTWKICVVDVVGLIFVVSSLFSNVISTLSLAITPLAALVVFHDKISGVKKIAMLLAICDDKKA